jgi:hypothetical protein
MITLNIVCIIWGIFSYFKIKQICKEKNKDFSPFETNNVFYFLGFVIGLGVLVTSTLYVCIRYLP